MRRPTKVIERKAEELLARQRRQRPPLDVKAIARALKARVVEYEKWKPDLSGVLTWMENEPVIVLNALHSSQRKRFTIAHEIGHLILHAGRTACHDSAVSELPGFRRGPEASTGENDLEIEANQFAAALLMPRKWVIRDFERTLKPSELAEAYGVSEEAMTWRLINLRLV